MRTSVYYVLYVLPSPSQEEASILPIANFLMAQVTTHLHDHEGVYNSPPSTLLRTNQLGKLVLLTSIEGKTNCKNVISFLIPRKTMTNLLDAIPPSSNTTTPTKCSTYQVSPPVAKIHQTSQLPSNPFYDFEIALERMHKLPSLRHFEGFKKC